MLEKGFSLPNLAPFLQAMFVQPSVETDLEREMSEVAGRKGSIFMGRIKRILITCISAFQTSAFMKINCRMRFLVLVTISYAKKPNNLYFLDNSW